MDVGCCLVLDDFVLDGLFVFAPGLLLVCVT